MKKGLFIAGLALPTLVFANMTKENYEVHILKEMKLYLSYFNLKDINHSMVLETGLIKFWI